MTLAYQTLSQTWDVIVAGGGTAGAIAGIAAARAGARVLVIEAQGSLGGTGTNAWVTPLMRNLSAGENLNRGLTDELKARLLARGDGAVDPNGNDNWFNPEGMKFVLEQMLLSAGGEVLYHTHVVEPVMADDVDGRWLMVDGKDTAHRVPLTAPILSHKPQATSHKPSIPLSSTTRAACKPSGPPCSSTPPGTPILPRGRACPSTQAMRTAFIRP
ncbi:FAD-dependent oxidoreductase [Deinococcus radiopugnans]|uniref:FAD-dependent oxidoreductase n=1 Tax=Deinococcus radiopugnans TaxID=57497 RepID=UPI003609ACA4